MRINKKVLTTGGGSNKALRRSKVIYFNKASDYYFVIACGETSRQ
jgi:hypothetical protein